MSSYKITFLIESLLKPATSEEREIELFFTRHLEFVPRKGDMIAVIECDDLREVETVYWSPVDGLRVVFKFDPKSPIAWLRKNGWKPLHRAARRQ